MPNWRISLLVAGLLIGINITIGIVDWIKRKGL